MSEARQRAGAPPDTDTGFADFYRATVKPLVAFLLLQGATLADAADIAQETLIKAHRRWRDIKHPRAWAHRVASRALIDRLVHRMEFPVDEVPTPLLGTTPIDHWEQQHDIVREALKLPPRQRQVIAWTLAGYTPVEIATELNLSPGAVRQNLLLARRALAAQLREADR